MEHISRIGELWMKAFMEIIDEIGKLVNEPFSIPNTFLIFALGLLMLGMNFAFLMLFTVATIFFGVVGLFKLIRRRLWR
jgi:hypothetical protein